MPQRCAAPQPGAATRRSTSGRAAHRAGPSQPTHQAATSQVTPPTRPARRPGAVASCALAALVLTAVTGCSMKVDMTIATEGTYDAVLEMRDTSGTVLTSAEDCTALADPEALEVPQDAQVSAEPLSGGKDQVGCRVTVTDVEIPQASQAQEGAMVVRDGDVYTVTMTAPDLGDLDDPSALAPSQEPGATGSSLNEMVDTRVSVTFPGAVTEADGGSVSGSTVTWDDTDALLEGVTASGYAEDSRGLSWWGRTSTWVIAGLVVSGTALGLAAAIRRHRPRQSLRPGSRTASRGRQGRRGGRRGGREGKGGERNSREGKGRKD